MKDALKLLMDKPKVRTSMRKYDCYAKILDLIEIDIGSISDSELRVLADKMREELASNLMGDWWEIAGTRNYGWG